MISSSSLINKQEQRFRSLAFLTVIVIYLLILAGGIVRSTGSGMGCPDWPKCFGQWVPPTEASQLPPNYQAIYGAKLKGEIEFNAVKTWIEYVNRLLGVLSGFFVFSTLLASFTYWRRDKAIVWGSSTAFLMTGVNGWLGSKVVSTELAQYMITIHFLCAIIVVFALIFVLVRSNSIRLYSESSITKSKSLQWLLLIAMLVTVTQIILGTQVRDALDTVVKQVGYAQRTNWISNLDWRFYSHRSFSLIVLLIQVVIIYQLRKLAKGSEVIQLTKALIAVVFVEIGTGMIMAYFSVPAIAQPVHLVLAVVMIGLQFMVWLLLDPTLIVPKGHNQTTGLIEV